MFPFKPLQNLKMFTGKILTRSHKLQSHYHKILSRSHKLASCYHKRVSHCHKLWSHSHQFYCHAISLSTIPNLHRGHPFTSIPFKLTYTCRLLVTFIGRMFPITLHVQLYTIMIIVTYLETFRGHLLIITGILHYCF